MPAVLESCIPQGSGRLPSCFISSRWVVVQGLTGFRVALVNLLVSLAILLEIDSEAKLAQ